MTTANGTAAQVTLSGRELALMRRQALALRGKVGATRSAAPTRPASHVVSRTAPAAAPGMVAAAVQRPAVAASAVVVPAPQNAARQRRQALSQAGKAALPARASSAPSGRTRPVAQGLEAGSGTSGSCGCGCNGAGCTPSDPVAVSPAMAACVPASVRTEETGVSAVDARSTRALARARRVAMATDGKAGQRRVAQATKLAAVLPQQDWQLAIDKGATGRQVAMQRRMVRALVGRSEASSSSTPRPSGRVRVARNESAPVPSKVGVGHTLSGQSVSGTLVDGHRKVTGTEAGACRHVTGTEYLGVEQFDKLCSSRPAPNPAKVAVSTTLRDQKVTGTEVGRSTQVTGDELGACRGITGTEYLAREHYAAVCDSAPAVTTPRKVSVMSSQGGQTVSGTDVQRASKVTGDESGAARQLTGTQYMNTAVASSSAGTVAPTKVAVVQTLAGGTVTGTEVARSPKVTGDDRGGCRPVTGTDYIGTQQLQFVCASIEPVLPVAKVGQDHTWRGQSITGSRVGRSGKVTGDEHGGCAPISGTPYIGRSQYQAFCEAPQQADQQLRLRSEAVIPAAAVTGDRPGAGGSVMTGDERGACGPVSGTPYIGSDNMPAQCPPSGRFVPRARPAPPVATASAPQDFSIKPPSRQAQERGLNAVTGTGFSTQRITGPVNKAGGLITGTPEFRHREPALFQAVPPAAAPIVVPRAAERLTGEGSQAGAPISGDAWQSSGRVTGTEGSSSLARNPSQRGQARGTGMNAQQFRDVERAALPESRITGSSGNTLKGAAVTVSGGARG